MKGKQKRDEEKQRVQVEETRITGMLNFVVFLLCLFKLQVYRADDLQAVINKVFNRYMLLMRKIQLVYVLEPAGSHGVWGLDDY